MSSLDASFWIGISAAIPLSIAANLFTPQIQQWLARRNATRAAKQAQALREELESIERLVSEPARLQTFLLESVLLITLLTTLFGVLSGACFVLSEVFGAPRLFASVGQLIALFGGVAVTRECVQVLRKSQRARDPDRYRSKVEAQLKELE